MTHMYSKTELGAESDHAEVPFNIMEGGRWETYTIIDSPEVYTRWVPKSPKHARALLALVMSEPID